MIKTNPSPPQRRRAQINAPKSITWANPSNMLLKILMIINEDLQKAHLNISIK